MLSRAYKTIIDSQFVKINVLPPMTRIGN